MNMCRYKVIVLELNDKKDGYNISVNEISGIPYSEENTGFYDDDDIYHVLYDTEINDKNMTAIMYLKQNDNVEAYKGKIIDAIKRRVEYNENLMNYTKVALNNLVMEVSDDSI